MFDASEDTTGRRRFIGALIAALAGLGACGRRPAAAAGQVLQVWAHAGRAAERRVLQQQAARFNAENPHTRVALTFLPEASYNGQVQAAALAGALPDVLEFDGPYLYNYAWQGRLRPLDDLLPAPLRAALLPSIIAQGTYRGHLYSAATFDSGLGLYARRSALAAVAARVPHGPADAWSVAEFERILARLARRDPDGAVLDLKLNYPDEWFTYGFSPALQSAGGDLINRSTYLSADGVLNGAAAVSAMRHIQSWFQRGYVDDNIDDAAFTSGRVALSWAGHWVYPGYRRAVGDDLLLLPLPNFGIGTRTGQGSWNWGITVQCRQPRQAMRFLAFLLRPREVLAMSDANGAVPGTRPAIARSPLYHPGGPLRLFVEQLEGGYAVPRPRTPAYPVISAAFAQAFRDIRDKGGVQAALDEAVAAIDRDIRDNHGYPPAAIPPHARSGGTP